MGRGDRHIQGLFLLMQIVALVGCLERRSQSDYGLPIEETFRFQLNGEPPTLDWSRSTDTQSSLILYNIMEGLTEIDFRNPDLPASPALAENWETTDGREWKWRLKQGVVWTDGEELTAQHVVDGFERCLNPRVASQTAFFLFPILNAEEYSQGKIEDFSQVGVQVLNQRELLIILKEPMAIFPYLLSSRCSYPVRRDLLARFGDRWTKPENLVTLGPYRVKRWDHDRAIVLERSGNYHGAPAKTRYVIGYVLKESSTALSLFQSGRLDATSDLPSKLLKGLQQRPDYFARPALATYFYVFNTLKPPVHDVKVRRAISMAIDREQIVKILGGGELALSSWVPDGMPGKTSGIGLKFDPQGARRLIEEAGYGADRPFPRLDLAFNTMEEHSRIAENVQGQLKKNLGIKVRLMNEEWKSYLSRIQSNPPHLFRLGWVGDYPDPESFLSFMMSSSPNNRSRWKSSRFDLLVRQGRSSLDPFLRWEYFNQAQRLLVEQDVPVIPIFTRQTKILVSRRVRDFPLNPLRIYQFKELSLERSP